MLRKLRPFIPDWLLGALCLLIPALYNSFPLLTSDSGAYIRNGYTLQLPLDRPLTYSLFLRVTSAGITLWGVVAAQAGITSALLLLIARRLLGPAYRRSSFAATMLLLGAATSAGWFVGQLMPDIFTAMLLLAILLLHQGVGRRWLRVMLYLLVLGAMMAHNSNLLTGGLLALLLLAESFRRKDALLRRTASGLALVSAAAWLSLSAMNSIAGRGFRPSSASHVFLMCRMSESGLMDDFLEDYCTADTTPYKLCAFRGKLPNRQWNFMWEEESPLYKTGGWQANEDEYNRIIRKTLTTPKYMILHGIKAAHATLRQLPLLYVGDGFFQFNNDSSPQREIYNHFRGEQKEFNASAQQTGDIHIEWWNPLIILTTLLSMAAALLLAGRGSVMPYDKAYGQMLRLSLLFLLINAAVTATLATVIGRYESRVVWILPFLAILYIVRRMSAERVS